MLVLNENWKYPSNQSKNEHQNLGTIENQNPK